MAQRQNWAKSSQSLFTSQKVCSHSNQSWKFPSEKLSSRWLCLKNSLGVIEALPMTFPVQGCANPAVPPLPQDHHKETALTFSLFSSCSKGWKASVSTESVWFLFRAGLEPSRFCCNTEGTAQDWASVFAQAHFQQ